MSPEELLLRAVLGDTQTKRQVRAELNRRRRVGRKAKAA
jgi:hypothetical protein